MFAMSANEDSNAPKRRGRPRKNVTLINKQVKTKPQEKKKLNEDDEIVLDLPLFDDSSEKNNVYTTKTPSSDNISKKETIHSLSSFHDSGNNATTTMGALKKKDLQIKQLKNEIESLKKSTGQENTITITKEHKRIMVDLKLINLKDNKPVLVDKTNISCFWCTYEFDTLPCFLPDRYFKGYYYVFGCFCSFGCAAAYNMKMDDYRTHIRHGLLSNIYHSVFKTDKPVPIAEQKEITTKYGGPISIDTFRDPLAICKKEHRMLIPPMIPLISQIEEITKSDDIIPAQLKKKKTIPPKSVSH